jgi:hypothetical protein
MPTEDQIRAIPLARLWERRGTLWTRRKSPGSRRWARLVSDPRLPRPGPDSVVVLTGRTTRDLLDLAMFWPFMVEGKDLYAIFLDDPHPSEIAAWSRAVAEPLGGLLRGPALARAWEALWLQVYLHEVGHIQYARRHGWGGAPARSEDFAESFAWHELGRLRERDTCLAAWGLSILVDVE